MRETAKPGVVKVSDSIQSRSPPSRGLLRTQKGRHRSPVDG